MREYIYQEVPERFHAQLMETLEKLPEEKTEKRRKSLGARKWLVPLAAVLALGTMTAAAAGIYKWQEAAKARFGVSGELEDKLTMDGVAREEHTVVTEAGLEFRLLQSVRTDRTMYYLCQVTLPEGIKINEDTAFESGDYESDAEFGGITWNFVHDSREEEGYLLEIELRLLDGVDYAGQEATICLRNLVQTEKTEVTDMLLEGEWKIPVTLSGDVDTVLYEVNQQIRLGIHTLEIEKVEASPFLMKLYMEEEESQHALRYYPTAVTGIKSGDGNFTEQACYLNTSGHSDENTGEFYYSISLDSAIDPTRITEILLNQGEARITPGSPEGEKTEAVPDPEADQWKDGELPADAWTIQERYGNEVAADNEQLYLYDITCRKIKSVLDLTTLSFDREKGGEIVPFGLGTVYILPFEKSDVVYAFELVENDQGEHQIYEMPAEQVLSSDSYRSHREAMLKNQGE